MCLAWLPYRIVQDEFGAAQPIAGTLFTLVFIGSALFLLAGRAVLGDVGTGPHPASGRWLAPLLLAMYARYHVDRIAGWFSPWWATETFTEGAEALLRGIPLVAGVVLLLLAWRPWHELRRPNAAGA